MRYKSFNRKREVGTHWTLIDVKIVKRMLKLIGKLKFHMREKRVRWAVLLVTDVENC